MLTLARANLTQPVRLFAQLAIDAARGGDDLYTTSLMTLADSLSEPERARLVKARDGALAAIHEFADWLDRRQGTMPDWKPMGEAQLQLPAQARAPPALRCNADRDARRGRAGALSRSRGDAQGPELRLARPGARQHVPADQAEFLAAYEARLEEIVGFLSANNLVTIPPYMGKFFIRQLPEAFKPTSPGGFMNPPGIYDRDPSGFYFIPVYNPKSGNFYIRAAIEDPRPILGHEGIPGHFLQLSIANHLTDEIRRQHGDNTFVEGWALYGEEMMMREGLYPDQSPSQGQVLRLTRYRAARIGVDVNLQTGRWTFEQAVKYFMEAGGLDREAAEGEAAGAAASRRRRRSATWSGSGRSCGCWGAIATSEGAAFRLGAFHDQLISYGSLPLSVIEWLMFGDSTAVRATSAR